MAVKKHHLFNRNAAQHSEKRTTPDLPYTQHHSTVPIKTKPAQTTNEVDAPQFASTTATTPHCMATKPETGLEAQK
jgi:hypothetical protein